MVITKKSPASPPRGGSGGNPIHRRRSPSTLLIPSPPPAHATGQSSLVAGGGGTWSSCTRGGEERSSRWLTCSGSAWRGGGWSRAALRRAVARWLLLRGSLVQRGVAAVQGTVRGARGGAAGPIWAVQGRRGARPMCRRPVPARGGAAVLLLLVVVACGQGRRGARPKSAPAASDADPVSGGCAGVHGARWCFCCLAAAQNHGGSWLRAALLRSCRHGAWQSTVACAASGGCASGRPLMDLSPRSGGWLPVVSARCG